MPQMAPISWLILFIIFSITLILFNIINYYSVLPKKTILMEKSNEFKSKNLNWKW